MKIRYLICEKCGKKEVLNNPPCQDSNIANIMLSKCYCYECSSWEVIKADKSGKYQIINGVCYMVLPSVSKKDACTNILGQDGKEMYFLLEDGNVIYSNDTWLVGRVPQTYMGELQDTGWLITKRAYNIIRRAKWFCRKKGCMDRYHCYLYTLLAEKDGPFNKIPKDYIVGSEHCGRFVNMTRDIYRYDVLRQVDSEHFLFK